MKSHSIEVAAHKAEKATNDPLYKEVPQKKREEGNRILSEFRTFCVGSQEVLLEFNENFKILKRNSLEFINI